MIKFKKTLLGILALILAITGWFSYHHLFSGLFQSDLESSFSHELDPFSEQNLSTSQEFVLFTMPKTGTHLLRPILENLTEKNSISYWSSEVCCQKSYLYDKNMINLLLRLPEVLQVYWLHQPIPTEHFLPILDYLNSTESFLVTHAPFLAEMERVLNDRNAIVFFIFRDPRDWVISVIKHPPVSGVDIYGNPIGDQFFSSLDIDNKIDTIINGTNSYYSIQEVYEQFLPWLNSPVCCPLRLEALLGSQGGLYSDKDQLKELRKISNVLNINISDEDLLRSFHLSYGKGAVFSKGKAGTWRDYFKESHKNNFKKKFGDILIELGYEKDDLW